MYVDADSIIRTAALIGAISAIVACLYKFFKWVDNQQAQDKKLDELEKTHEKDIGEIREELCLLCFAQLATLDGLHQLGANGNVSEAHSKLEKHINKKAHNNVR